MTDRTYNGWTTYETWVVNLWMSNDQGSDEYYREMAQEAYDTAEQQMRTDGSVLFTRRERATLTLADRLKDEHEERQSELTGVAGLVSDLLSAALAEVNWYEIAEHYISDIDTESEAA